MANRRLWQIRMLVDDLADRMDLLESQRIRDIRFDPALDTVTLLVEDAEAPAVLPGAEPPVINLIKCQPPVEMQS